MKKICSILLSLSLCFTFLLSTVSAAEPERSLHINLTADKNSLNPRQEFSVDLSVDDFQGISEVACFGPLTITYRTEAAQFLSFEPNSKFSASDFTVQEQNGKISIIYIPESSNPVSVLPEDAIGKLYFRASDVSISTGLQLQLASAKGFADAEYRPITAVAGKTSEIVIHPNLTPKADFFMKSSVSSAECGEEAFFSFQVNTSENIAYFGPAVITYDSSMLEYVGYDMSEDLDEEEIVLADEEGKLTLLYQDKDLGQTPIGGLTDLLNLKFKVKEFEGISNTTVVTIAEIGTVGNPEGDEIGFSITESASIDIFNVIEIYTKDDLDAVRKKLNAHYRLMNDIAFTKEDFAEDGEFYNDGQGWKPIGDNDIPFTGIFDGNGHVIDGLQMCISSDSTLFVGLFGCNEGNVKNLGVINGNIRGTATSIYNVYVGGIAGHNRGTIAQCYNGNKVEGTPSQTYAYVGGISGFNQSGTVTDCFNIGEVCGFATYPTASVSVGGISGDGYQQTVKNCYNVGNIHGKANYDLAYVGGVLGNLGNTPGSIATNCYYLNNVEKGIGKGTDTCIQHTVDQMMQQDTFAGFDFDTVWTMAGNTDYLYPELKNVPMHFNKKLEFIEVSTLPSKLEYLEGKDKLDVTGGKLTLTYNNGTTEVINLTTDMVTGFDNTQIGPQTLTVTYKGKITTFEVEIIAKSLIAVEVAQLPNKTVYVQGQEADLTGGKLLLIYNNDETEVISMTPEMIDFFDNTMPGEMTITLSYEGFTVEIPVEVIERVIERIEVTKLPNKTEYLQGQWDFSTDGMEVTGYYNDGTSQVLDDFSIDAFPNWGKDGPPAGKMTIGVYAEGAETSFDIEIIAIDRIAVTHPMNKTEFWEGETLDFSGLEITAYYENGATRIIGSDDYTTSGFDNGVGEHTVTIQYLGKETAFSFTVKAIEVSSLAVTTPPAKTEYLEGKETLDVTGGKLTLTYNNGTSEVIDLTADIVSGFDNTQVGKQTLTVTYKGKITTFEVEIVAKSLTEIKVTKKPNKLSYLEGEAFNPAGMEVTAYYNNGISEKITDYEVNGYTSTPGSKEIIITYRGRSATSFWITVAEKTLIGIEVTTPPDKLEYFEWEPFDPTGMVVTAHYDNGTSETVTDYSFGGYEFIGPETETVEIYYKGYTVSFAVTVKSRVLESIIIVRSPNKLTYIEGNLFDSTGMQLQLRYSNSTFETITSGWQEEYDFSSPGQQTVTITYNGKKTTLTVTVTAKQVTSIAIASKPNKTTYLEGQELDTTGLKLKVSYNNGIEEVVTGNWTITGYDRNRVGKQTITVNYQGHSATFEVTVTAKVLTEIRISKQPNKLTYMQGESLNTAGLELTLTFNNGTTQKVTSEFTISGYNKNKVGKQTVTVTYQGKTAAFTVTVSSRVPSSITSNVYTVGGGWISKIPAGTTVSTLVNGINEKQYIKVFKGNSEVSGNTVAGTGMVVKLMDGNTVKQSVTVVVTGDTNGDGGITITDMIAVKAHVLKKSTLSGAAAKAADTNGDNGISITDFIQIKAHILGKSKIQAR